MISEEILNNPIKKDLLVKAVKEASNLKVIAKANQDALRDVSKRVKEDLELAPKLFNKLVKVYYEASIEAEKQEFEEFEALFTAVAPQVATS